MIEFPLVFVDLNTHDYELITINGRPIAANQPHHHHSTAENKYLQLIKLIDCECSFVFAPCIELI